MIVNDWYEFDDKYLEKKMKNNDKYKDLIQKIKENRISDEEIIECLQIRQISVNYTVLSHIYS